MKGFKAGALNKALELTDPAATFIGVIDSDYQVAPDWLNTVVPAFGDPQVALVQAPQDYRDADESLLKKCCYEEYRGFFHVGMVERDEHNAIIQHGTMCMVRRTALVEVGGWAPWCITEDTELGLRLFEAGYVAHYTPKSLGRGLMPDTYAAYKGQRYRWVYGAMQILKRHGPMLFGRAGKLTLAQRYHFVAGWLPWFADAFALIFCGACGDLDRADGRGAEVLRRPADGAVIDRARAVRDQDGQDDRAASGQSRRRNPRIRSLLRSPAFRSRTSSAEACCSDWLRRRLRSCVHRSAKTRRRSRARCG